jgi:riboflavin kinase/FMN adenylyltransferase
MPQAKIELIRGLHNLRERHRGCVLSIGNFDGFHRGHQALVARLREHAARLKVPAAVLIFEPTPRELFAPKDAPGRVATFRDKLSQLESAGVARVLCVRFGQRFAAIAAQDFVERVLVKQLGVKAVLVGDDFRFGAGRSGDLALLQRLGARHGFVAESVSAVQVDGERASSTSVRAALAVPDLERTARLLGRPYALSGRVRRGLQLGRKLNMPTANIVLKRKPALKFGVYVVQAEANARRWMGVANIGVRPTLAQSRCLLEAHLFGAAGDLYGQVLQVRFLKFLRPELRFDSLEALAQQMQQDGEQARAWLKQFVSVSSRA